MTTTMSCPGCQTPLRLRDDMAGKKIKCPRCGSVVTVPEEEAVVVEVVSAAEQITAELPAPKANTAIITRPCPQCGEPVARTARTCRHCQVPLDEDDEGRLAKRSPYKPCPRCGGHGAERVIWTPWGSFYGPALFTHVRCPECSYGYNGKSGRSNLVPAIFFVTIPLLLILAIVGLVIWAVYARMFAPR